MGSSELLPGGDPTVLGWGTTVAYLVASGLLLRAFLRRRRGHAAGAPAWVYLLVAALMLALGLNKQLDLQALVEGLGRRVALEQGWYDERRRVQRAFVGGLLLLTAIGAATLAFVLRRAWRSVRLVALGVALVGVYALARAAHFHHVDLVGLARIGASPWSCLIELLGVACVGAAGARVARHGAAGDD